MQKRPQTVRHQSQSGRFRGTGFKSRLGAATLDYVLVLVALIPMAAASFSLSKKLIRLAYDMILVIVSSPFM